MSKQSHRPLLGAFSSAILLLSAGVAARAQESPAQENDLIGRFGACRVLTVTGDQFGAIFTVSGRVVSAEGNPVGGAIVVLRESSTSRISSESKKYLYVEDRHLVRAPDVFARTTTDAEGKFQFRDVKSPAFPTRWSNSWRGDVVAAHDEHGIGWVALGDKQEQRRIDSDLTLVLKPTASISGRFLSPDQVAIEGATVSVYRLTQPTWNLRSRNDLDLQMSQLTPRVQTDAEGRFAITGIPEGMVAQSLIRHADWMLGSAAIATSPDVALGKHEDRSGYLGDQPVVAVPADVIADPGLSLAGHIVDADGNPVSDVAVSFASSVDRETTGADGKFVLRFTADRLERDRKRGTTSKILIAPKQGSGFLARYHDALIDDLAAETAATLTVQRGVLIGGKIVTEDGKPVPNATVRPAGDTSLHGSTTESDGTFKMLLPPGEHLLAVGTDEPGYALPKRVDIYRMRDADQAAKLPHLRVDVSDGAEQQLPPLVVSKVKTLQVIASLPDGRPATGATAIIKDQVPSRSTPTRTFTMPPRTMDKSGAVLTNALGRADLLPQGVPSEKAFVELKSATSDGAYDASVPLSRAVDGVIHVVLESAWIVEGRVLIDGKPVVGATVSVGQSTPYERSFNGRTIMGATVSNHVQANTDQTGSYRAAVSPDKQYSVSVQSLPSEPDFSPGIGYRPTPEGGGRLRVKDFLFKTGDQELAGRVIDAQGNPIPGAYVQVMRERDVTPSFWVGHRRASQSETDNQGRFHLKHMPQGTYRLIIRGPRHEGTRRTASTMTTAESGTLDVEVILSAPAEPELPRLQPQRIEPIPSSNAGSTNPSE